MNENKPGDTNAPAMPGDDLTITPHVELITVDQQIKNEVAKIDVSKQAVASFVRKFGALKIADVNDVAGYKAVDEARKLVKKKAIAVEGKTKQLNEDYLKIINGVRLYGKSLSEPLRKLEDELDAKLKVIDDEKVQIETERLEAETKKANQRVEDLIAAGIAFNGRYYAIGDTISVDIITLKAMTDDEFTALQNSVILEKTRIDDRETERLEAERKQKEADELLRQQNEDKQKELDEQQKKIDQQLAEIAEFKLQQKKIETNRRAGLLLELGLLSLATTSGAVVYRLDTKSGAVEVSLADVEDLSPDDWQKRLEGVQKLSREITAKELTRINEETAAANQYDSRVAQLKALELVPMPGAYGIYHDVTEALFKIDETEIKTFDADQWVAALKRLKTWKQNQDAEGIKITKQLETLVETKRKNGQSDFTNISEFNSAMLLSLGEAPKLKRADMQALMDTFIKKVKGALSDLTLEAEKLSK
jgi:hypothetical protein